MIRSVNIKEIINLNVNIIDIRSVEKYNTSHIPGAKNAPKILLIKDPGKYLNKNDVYYIYCQYGKTSIQVCSYLLKLGYKVVNILGGYESYLLEK